MPQLTVDGDRDGGACPEHTGTLLRSEWWGKYIFSKASLVTLIYTHSTSPPQKTNSSHQCYSRQGYTFYTKVGTVLSELCVSCKEHVVQPSYSPPHSSPVNSDDIFSLYPYVTPGDSVVFLLYANLVGFFLCLFHWWFPVKNFPAIPALALWHSWKSTMRKRGGRRSSHPSCQGLLRYNLHTMYYPF